MASELRVVFKAPGARPEWQTVANELHALQDLVGGPIQAVRWDDRYLLVVNVEGKLTGEAINFFWAECHSVIAGPAFWVAECGEDFASVLNDELLDEITEYTRLWWENDEDELEVGLTLGEIDAAMREAQKSKEDN